MPEPTPIPEPSAPVAGEGGPRRDLQIAGDPSSDTGAIAGDTGAQSAGNAGAIPGECGAQTPPPPSRKGGSLIVETPPRPPQRTIGSRLRTHTEGSLTAGATRIWTGPAVPSFVQLTAGTLELFLLDPARVSAAPPAPGAPATDGFLAFYRDPYGASSCALSGDKNCAFGAAIYHCSGRLIRVLGLNAFMSRPDRLEVQDVRLDGGVLYFNEACQSYSKEAQGKCSSLVAVDIETQKVLWRSPPLTSNNRFLVAGKYLITGYGFTAEPDFLFVVRRSDGTVAQRVPVTSGHEEMAFQGPDAIAVGIYGGTTLRYRLEGFDGDKPRLVKIGEGKKAPEPPPPGPSPRHL